MPSIDLDRCVRMDNIRTAAWIESHSAHSIADRDLCDQFILAEQEAACDLGYAAHDWEDWMKDRRVFLLAHLRF